MRTSTNPEVRRQCAKACAVLFSSSEDEEETCRASGIFAAMQEMVDIAVHTNDPELCRILYLIPLSDEGDNTLGLSELSLKHMSLLSVTEVNEVMESSRDTSLGGLNMPKSVVSTNSMGQVCPFLASTGPATPFFPTSIGSNMYSSQHRIPHSSTTAPVSS